MLILISTPSQVHTPREHANLLELFDRGLRRFHLRKPGWSEGQIAHYVDQIGAYRDRVVIHGIEAGTAARLGVVSLLLLRIGGHAACHRAMA